MMCYYINIHLQGQRVNGPSDPTKTQLIEHVACISYLQILNNLIQFAVTVEQIPYKESIREPIFSLLEQMLCTESICIDLSKSSE